MRTVPFPQDERYRARPAAAGSTSMVAEPEACTTLVIGHRQRDDLGTRGQLSGNMKVEIERGPAARFNTSIQYLSS